MFVLLGRLPAIALGGKRLADIDERAWAVLRKAVSPVEEDTGSIDKAVWQRRAAAVEKMLCAPLNIIFLREF